MTGTERMTPGEAALALASLPAPLLLDVRTPREWQQLRIAGSVNVPLNRLPERLSGLPRDRRILVHCAGGYRSSIAAGLLQRAGLPVVELGGGVAAWDRAGLPVQR